VRRHPAEWTGESERGDLPAGLLETHLYQHHYGGETDFAYAASAATCVRAPGLQSLGRAPAGSRAGAAAEAVVAVAAAVVGPARAAADAC
jgi:hypothetical protein